MKTRSVAPKSSPAARPSPPPPAKVAPNVARAPQRTPFQPKAPDSARAALRATTTAFTPAATSGKTVGTLDPATAKQIDDYCKKLGSRGIVVIQGGQVVHSYLAPGVKPNQAFDTWSMAKTFTSALTGIAIDQGLIKSLDEPISDFIPEFKGAHGTLFHPQDGDKREITIRDVLSGTSGMHWDLVGDYGMSLLAHDKSAAAVGNHVEAAPGEEWRYNNHAVQLMEVVLRRAIEKGIANGRTDLVPDAKDPNVVEHFARKFLWDPIGMGPETSWKKDGEGHVLAYSSVNASFDGLAKFGQLLMNNGRVGDRQIIPAAYVHAMTHASQDKNPNYGLLTWVKAPASEHLTNTNNVEKGSILPAAPDGSFALEGFGQNFVVAVPQKDLMIIHLKPAPILEKNTERPSHNPLQDIGNVLKDGWDMINDGQRSDEDRLTEMVLRGLH